MLQIVIPEMEIYDEARNEFINIKTQTIRMEHSLVSVSKWESKWCKPFLDSKDKTLEEIRDYAKCMTITQNVDPNAYYGLSESNYKEIIEYINKPMTATWFTDHSTKGLPGKKSSEQITSELIYYWMTVYNIPFECQKWHLNRLLTLVRICNVKESGEKKMSKRDIMAQNKALNAARRAKHRTRG